MPLTPAEPQPVDAAVNAFVAAWEDAVCRRDLDAVTALLAEDVTFRSPAVHRPYAGRETVTALLGVVTQVFGELTYTGVYASGSGGVVMQFETTVQGPERAFDLEGVDIFQLGPDGRVRDMCVMIRPFTGLQALAAAIAAKLS
jgi:ketosteroid isomerase-like protein